MKLGQILVIVGESGVGKDTVLNAMYQIGNISKLPTYTTRDMRKGEINGVHYHFVTQQEFFTKQNNGQLLDCVNISGKFYGIPTLDVVDATCTGKNIALTLIPDSARLFKEEFQEAKIIKILPPDSNSVLTRLKSRGMIGKELEDRLKDDPAKSLYDNNYDFTVVNHHNQVNMTARKILAFAGIL